MHIARFTDSQGTIRFGRIRSIDEAEELAENNNGQWKPTGKTVTINNFLSPVQPAAILCIGLNYKMHALETGMPVPERPILFMKNPGSVTGHKTPVVLPKSCRNPLQVDYEIELGVIIGKPAKNVSEDQALDYVKGYTVCNDVSARIWQQNAGGGQWVKGKSFDTFCPMGPEMVTADEIPDPDNLDITLKLNGETMQQGNTSDMVFSVKKLIACLSEDTTLLPDTIILTGTPSGVGFTRNPPIFLKPGDRMSLTIDQIGTLENQVI
jgi:2-keto-4-pentenoate hydratase/2-oxohepta-3-ene-1,7-dioic acid hydratase in catechol pathway